MLSIGTKIQARKEALSSKASLKGVMPMLRAALSCLLCVSLVMVLGGCSDDPIVSDKKKPAQVKVQMNECEEAAESGGNALLLEGGEKIDIPDEFDDKQSNTGIWGSYTYWWNHQGWNQGKIGQMWHDAGAKFDESGLAVFNGRYGVVMKNTFGDAGDYIDIVYKDGNILHAWLQDCKSVENAGAAWAKWGHSYEVCNVLEFYIEGGPNSGGDDGGLNKVENIATNPAKSKGLEFITGTVDYVINYGSAFNMDANAIPNARATSSSSASAVSNGEIVGGDVAEKCWNFLKSVGCSDEAAAGLLGNFEGESSMKPDNIQGNGAGPAAGLYQMEKYGDAGSRWGKMKAYAESKGKDWTDLTSQLEYLDQEAPGQFDQYTGKTYTYPNGVVTWWPEKMTWDEFKKLTDIEKTTEIFMRVYERPSAPHLDRRIAAAREYYERFKGTAATHNSETSESCSENGRQKYGASGVANGDEYIQFQGRHYHNGEETAEIDASAMDAACGATSFVIGVNMLLGEKHKYCGVEVWQEMGGDTTEIGWGDKQAYTWLEEKGLDSTIEITGQNTVQNREDLSKALQEGNVVVASSRGNCFKSKDGSQADHPRGHYIIFYKMENGKFYADDCGNRRAGGGVEYTESDIDSFFSAPGRNGGGSLAFKRK